MALPEKTISNYSDANAASQTNTPELVSVPENYKKNVQYIVKMYDDIKGFVHGFQKDAIQNAVGARLNGSSWRGWKCEITLFYCGVFPVLTVQDFGTTGLTGPNLPVSKIDTMSNNDEPFPEEWRLARISSRNNSGGNSLGGGLFGVGKTVYAGASSDMTYYYESISKDGYRANLNKMGKMHPIAKEGEEAKKFIRESTGLEPMTDVGTRIIIINPTAEIINAVNDGTILRDINETWWRVIPLLNDDSYISINGIKATIPPEIINPANIERQFIKDSPEKVDDGYKVKRGGLFVMKELPEHLRGFYYYRKGMKIGEIRLDSVPEKIKNRYFGYIEVDEDWEQELAEIENPTHYDAMGKKKVTKQYTTLRTQVNKVFSEKMEEWGFSEKKIHKNEQLKSELEGIKEELEILFSEAGFEQLGKGESKSRFSVRWKGIKYPHENTKTVFDKDCLHFGFAISSDYSGKKDFDVRLEIKSSDGFFVLYSSNEIGIEQGDVYEENVDFIIDQKTAKKFEENFLTLVVTPKNVGKKIEKKLNFFYAKDTNKATKKDFEFTLFDRTMPRVNDKRVNSGESITGVKYRVASNCNFSVKMLLRVSSLNMENSGNLIEDIGKFIVDLLPFEEKIIDVGNIVFRKDLYESKLNKGLIVIRGSLIINEDCQTFQKGDRISSYDFRVFFNKNEKIGMEDSFHPEMVEAPDRKERAWTAGSTGNWAICLNISHPAFILAKDLYHMDYLTEQMLRQFVVLYIKEGNYSIFGPEEARIDEMSNLEVNTLIEKKIEEIWWKKCQR